MLHTGPYSMPATGISGIEVLAGLRHAYSGIENMVLGVRFYILSGILFQKEVQGQQIRLEEGPAILYPSHMF